MEFLVCISKAPDTTTRIAFTDGDTRFNEEGVQFIVNPYDEWYALVRALEIVEAQGGKVVIAAVGFSVILFVRTKIPDRLEPEFLPSAELEEGLFEHSNPVMEQDGEGNVGKRQRETGEAAAQRQQGRLEVAGTVMRSVIFVGLQPIKIGMLKRASHPPYAHTLFLLHNKQKV